MTAKSSLVAALALATASVAHAGEAEPASNNSLAAYGIIGHVSITQFYGGVVAGDGNRRWQAGGKEDGYLAVDLGKFAGWDGVSMNVHQEMDYGRDVNNAGDGSLLPVNTALAFPATGGTGFDTSINFTKVFSPAFSMSAGKFNMLDAASRAPLLGGGGEDTFQYVGLAAPVSGVTPPYLLGAMATYKSPAAIATVMLYDPRNAQEGAVLAHPFADGATISASLTVPYEIGGLRGFQGVRGVYSTQRGLDLASIPQLLLPPTAGASLSEKPGYWFGSYSVQQYLFQDPGHPGKGWGVFGQAAISDGNPNSVQSSAFVGLAGDSPLSGRENDRWGVGLFRYNYSPALVSSLAKIGIGLRDEYGGEAYYNLAAFDRFHVTADTQWIRPAEVQHPCAEFVGLRIKADLW